MISDAESDVWSADELTAMSFQQMVRWMNFQGAANEMSGQ